MGVLVGCERSEDEKSGEDDRVVPKGPWTNTDKRGGWTTAAAVSLVVLVVLLSCSETCADFFFIVFFLSFSDTSFFAGLALLW